MNSEITIQVLEELLKERGFQLKLGIYIHSNGEKLPTWVIKRPDTPEWGGVWEAWEKEPEFAEDSEEQVLFKLCGEAIATWNSCAWMYCKENQ